MLPTHRTAAAVSITAYPKRTAPSQTPTDNKPTMLLTSMRAQMYFNPSPIYSTFFQKPNTPFQLGDRIKDNRQQQQKTGGSKAGKTHSSN